MAVEPASFKLRFEEFACLEDDKIQIFLDDAALELNSVCWGDKYDLGLCYLAAHYLALSAKSSQGSVGPVGPIASRSVDGVSVTYARATSNSLADDYFSSTAYGQRYVALRKTLGIMAAVV